MLSSLLRWQFARLTLLATLALQGATVASPFAPNDRYFSPDVSIGFPGQWYLVNRAPATLTFTYTYLGVLHTVQATNVGLDANLMPAWQRGLTGKGVVIGIVGITGIEGDHPDLATNYRADLSRQFSQDPKISKRPQGPVLLTDNHDTPVAGIAAARGGNGLGMTGAAPFAGIAGFRVDNPDDTVNCASNQNYVDANYFASGVSAAGQITDYPAVSVRNRSYARLSPFTVEDPRVIRSLEDTANNNVVHVFAAGNFRNTPDGDTGRMQGNSLASAIAVAVIGSDGKFAVDCNYGASIFVTAPGAQLNEHALLVPAIDRAGLAGFCPGGLVVADPFPDPDYTSIFTGTSATAPIVSGIVALGKQLNPFLDVRWARHAFAVTSRVVDPNDASSRGAWQTNGAGLKFNPNYGFGLVDAGAFVDQIERMAFVTAPERYSVGKTAPAANNSTLVRAPKTESISLSQQGFSATGVNRLPIEAVEVSLDITSANRDALQGTLVSPAGTTSTFLTTSSQSSTPAANDDPSPAAGLQWTFVSNAFWGEDPFGTWKLSVADLGENKSVWNNYAITFHLGKMVLESGNLAIATDTTAHCVVLDFPSTTMSISKGVTFAVRDEVQVNHGTLRVEGRLQDHALAGLARSRVQLNDGQLSGTGTIATALGVVNSGGVVRPGDAEVVGTLSIRGGYTQEKNGVLEIDVGANAQSDALVIESGAVVLGGTLRLKLLPGVSLAAGTVIPIVRTEMGGVIDGDFYQIETDPGSPMHFRRVMGAQNLFCVEVLPDH